MITNLDHAFTITAPFRTSLTHGGEQLLQSRMLIGFIYMYYRFTGRRSDSLESTSVRALKQRHERWRW